MPRYTLVVIVLSMLGATGCTSIRSTMLERDETNSCWQKYPRLNGIPITLKVPTHVKLYVFDKHYLELIDVGDGEQEVVPVNLDVPVRDFAHELLYTEKIFTVDFKRPAAGSYNLRLDMTEDQYFAKIQHDVTDETIQRVTELLGKVLPDGGLFASPVSGDNTPDAKELRALVAVGVFEIDAPDFDHQVAAFLNRHINKAHDAWVVPPGVESINRAQIQPERDGTYRVPPCSVDATYEVSPELLPAPMALPREAAE